MRLLITRPREDAEALAGLLVEHGVQILIDPLLTIDYRAGPPLDLTDVQALLATSANGVRALIRRSLRRDLPLFAVGDATARTAIAEGFVHVMSATGDVEALARLVIGRLDPAAGTLLHAAASHVAGDLAGQLTRAGFAYRREVLYESHVATALSEATISHLRARQVDGVVLFSPRTAGTFTRLVDAADLAAALQSIVCFALSPAVTATATRLAWRDTLVASRPTQADLVETILASCRAVGSETADDDWGAQGSTDSRSPPGSVP